MSINKVILIGYVGADPELRYPDKDQVLARVSLATNYRPGNGEMEITDWHSVIFTGQNAQIVERYVRKGTRLYVEGMLRYREYDDKFKIHRRVAEIIVSNFELLGRKDN